VTNSPASAAPSTTSDAVAQNIARARKSLGWTLLDLENALTTAGHRISLSALSKIENRSRKVDVDDLMAIAVVLDVSPAALLLPVGDLDEVVPVTGGRGSVGVFWEWAFGTTSLGGNTRAYQARSLPAWVGHAGLEIDSQQNYELRFGLGEAEPHLISRSIVER